MFNSDGGDDETLIIDLAKVDSSIQEIIFTVTIHEAEIRKRLYEGWFDSVKEGGMLL